MNSAIHYLLHASGPQQVSYFDSNFSRLERTVRLSGYPHSAQQTLFAAVCRRAEQENTPIEIVHHRLDNSMQGVILPERSAGAFGFDVYDPEEPNVLAVLAPEHLAPILENLEKARSIFGKARLLHDEQEKIYLSQMDFSAADRLTEKMIDLLLGGKQSGRPGREIHRFFGAATADGNLDYVPEVTASIPKRYFIKGRPGTGKSTFLKKLARAALNRGYTVERYHCSLDPKSLDLVAVRELGFCLLDSTAPHEYFPSRSGDEILDMYQLCVTPGTDEAYAAQLQNLQTAYKELVQTAVSCLKEAKGAADRFDAALPQPDPAAMEQVKANLLAQLFSP